MSNDPPELGRGLFGYRKSAVNQILQDRDIMLRQAESRVRAAEGRVAELEGELHTLRERNARMEEQLDRLRAQLDALSGRMAGVEEAAAGTAAPAAESDVLAEEPEAISEGPAQGGPGEPEAPAEPQTVEAGWGQEPSWAEEPEEATVGIAGEGEEATSEEAAAPRAEMEEREESAIPYGFEISESEISARPSWEEATEQAAPGAEAETGEPEIELGSAEPVETEAGEPAEAGGEEHLWRAEEAPGAEPVGAWVPGPVGWGGEPGQPEEEPTVPLDTGPEPEEQAESGAEVDAFEAAPVAEGEPAQGRAEDEAATGERQAEPEAGPEEGSAAAAITNRFLTEELAGILRAAEESASRIVERARATTQEQLERSNRLWREVRAEVSRFASWRSEVEPVIQAVQTKVEGVRREIQQVPDRVRDALAPMAEAISSIDADLARLSEAATPPLLLTPSGLEAGEAEGWDDPEGWEEPSRPEGAESQAEGHLHAG